MSSSESGFASHVLLAWQQKLSINDLLNCASQLEAAQQYELAAVLYQTWLSRNPTPFNHFAYFNLGTALSNVGDLEGAEDAYLQADRAVADVRPAALQPRLVYDRLGQPDAAIAEWTWVADHTSTDNADERAIRLLALNGLGRVLEAQQQYAQALARLTDSLRMEPNQPDVLHHWVFLRAKQCVWPVYADIDGVDPELMRKSTSALAMIALSGRPRSATRRRQALRRQEARERCAARSPRRRLMGTRRSASRICRRISACIRSAC